MVGRHLISQQVPNHLHQVKVQVKGFNRPKLLVVVMPSDHRRDTGVNLLIYKVQVEQNKFLWRRRRLL